MPVCVIACYITTYRSGKGGLKYRRRFFCQKAKNRASMANKADIKDTIRFQEIM